MNFNNSEKVIYCVYHLIHNGVQFDTHIHIIHNWTTPANVTM